MSEIERYDFVERFRGYDVWHEMARTTDGDWVRGYDVWHEMARTTDGDWVLFTAYQTLAARLAEAERRATTLQADLDRAIESALKANAINTDWRRDWKAAIARAEAAEARVRELEPDAERYRWLRGDSCGDHSPRWTQWEIRCWRAPQWTADLRRAELDAAIDAARATASAGAVQEDGK